MERRRKYDRDFKRNVVLSSQEPERAVSEADMSPYHMTNNPPYAKHHRYHHRINTNKINVIICLHGSPLIFSSSLFAI